MTDCRSPDYSVRTDYLSLVFTPNIAQLDAWDMHSTETTLPRKAIRHAPRQTATMILWLEYTQAIMDSVLR